MKVYYWSDGDKQLSEHEVPDRLRRVNLMTMGALVDAHMVGDLADDAPLKYASAQEQRGAVKYAGLDSRNKNVALYFMADPEDDPTLARRWASADLDGHTGASASIGINPFAKRQVADSPYSHFDGTWEELAAMVKEAFPDRKAGYKAGVVLVSLNPDRFWSAVTPIKPGARLIAEFANRRAGEEPVLTVRVAGQKVRARTVHAVVYHKGVLGADAATGMDWEVVSINTSVAEGEEPMAPVTMARNHLGLPGGSKANYTADEFAKAIMFWATHAMCDPQASGS